jgi:N,N'-diacetyllegionaminate synthase
MKNIKLGNKWIGDGNPCYIVAEIGTSYRNFKEAKRLIDSAVKIGVDAIKFQTFEAETITTKNNFLDLKETGFVSQYELFKKLEIPKEEQLKIVQYANEKNIDIFSAPSHMNDLLIMKQMNLPFYKIGSDLACHIPLLTEVGNLKKPVIISTGMCDVKDVEEAVTTIQKTGNDKIIIMHCVSDYPSKPEDANLNVMMKLKEKFQIPVGYSDHSVDILTCLAATAMGANIIEKHLRHTENTSSPDDMHSLTVDEFQNLVNNIRYFEKTMGDGIKKPTSAELKNRPVSRVSIIALCDIPKGSIITSNVIDVRRPGTGIPPKFFQEIIGKTVIKEIKKDQPLNFDDFN